MQSIFVVYITVIGGGIKAIALIFAQGHHIIHRLGRIIFAGHGDGHITPIGATKAVGYGVGIGFAGLFAIVQIVKS